MNLFAVSTEINSKSAVARVCQLLLDFMTEDDQSVISRFLTYSEIAYYLSMHTMTVTKIFKALRENNIIHKTGQTATIIDKDALLAIADGDLELQYR